jgi:hypothetical protein
MLYKVFADDSGKKEYKTPYSRDFIDKPPPFKDYEEFWRDNYFVICAVRVKQEDMGRLNDEINTLKQEYFGTTLVEIKSVWLRYPNKRKKQYLDPFGITAERLNEFGEKLTDFISSNCDTMQLLAIVFDKRFYGDAKRATPEGLPLLKSVQCLFERLQKEGNYNIVVFDQLESSLRADRGEHGKVLGVHEKNQGMEKVYIREYDAVTDVKFLESKNEKFLQIADICAYNVHRQFVQFGREWVDKGGEELNMYPYFERIRCNFCYNPSTGLVRGYGLCCIPDSAKNNWDIRAGCDYKKTSQE